MFLNKKLQKVAPKFYCEDCDYSTSKKSNWRKHIETRIHTLNAEVAVDMYCGPCDHLSFEQNNKKKYIETTTTSLNKNGYFLNNGIMCSACDKSYKTRAGLWYHSKKCKKVAETEKCDENILDNPILVMELMKQNTEFKNLIIEQNKTIMELAKSGSISNNHSYNNNTNNSHNKFNLNFFLNEQCKDAISIKEIIDTLKLNITDLDITREFGLAEGISRIFLRNLKELDVYKRPIHCSDLKREVVYLKDENGWIKDDDENKKLASLIKIIANKNIKQIPDWVAAHPNCKDSSNKHNDNYLMMLSESMGSFSDHENELTTKKIMKNVMKKVFIEKKQ